MKNRRLPINNKHLFITSWNTKEGVFLSPNGKYIVRVKVGKNKRATTLSQHKTKEEAERIYNYYKS